MAVPWVLATLLISATVEAQPAAAGAGQTAAPAAKAADGVKRDPQGLKGLSPHQELLLKGDRAYLARDFDAALSAYREALQSTPHNALSHLRVGTAELAKGDAKAAEAAWLAGLNVVGADGSLKGKLLFALADLREREKDSDGAIARWKEYAKNAEQQREAPSYPATASERIARNEAYKRALAEGAEVKARIAKRLQEADAAARKSAADPKNK